DRSRKHADRLRITDQKLRIASLQASEGRPHGCRADGRSKCTGRRSGRFHKGIPAWRPGKAAGVSRVYQYECISGSGPERVLPAILAYLCKLVLLFCEL